MSQPMITAVNIMLHEAQISFGDLPPYLTYVIPEGELDENYLRRWSAASANDIQKYEKFY